MSSSGALFRRVTTGLGALGLALSTAAWAGVLVQTQVLTDGDPGVTGLQAPRQVVVSPDGENVYVAAEQGTITVWSRDDETGSGKLHETQVLQDGVGGVKGLTFVSNVSISGDGKTVYAGGTHAGTLAVFSRDAATGKLTEVQLLTNGLDLPSGLGGIVATAVSRDLKNLYSVGTLDGAIVAFERDRKTGKLNPIQVIEQGVGGVTGLTGAFPVMVSGDGRFVYVGGRLDNTVKVYGRDRFGKLSLVQTLNEGQNGVFGIAGARYILESGDAQTVYIAGLAHSTLAVFSRNASTGKLTEIQLLANKVAGITGLASPTSIVESYDHLHLFVVGFDSFAIDSFHRNRLNGKLTRLEEETQDSVGDVTGLVQVISAAMSPGGHNLYAVSFFSNSLSVFNIQEIDHDKVP
ncbi:MAG TPA: beta-propeller fold lactonase family protein [Thermoanaerobaculia bacterium]|nr:beta-propeller fold lactonase family protein [Thermoanaerobaculia bacterium]